MEITLKRRGVVIICGPTTTGKSGVASRICKQCKKNSIKFELISYDDISCSKRKVVDRIFKFQTEIKKAIANLGERSLIVIEVPFVQNEQLSSLMAAVRILGGPKLQITLLEMNLNFELHINFWKNRVRGEKPSLRALKKERALFEKVLETKEYAHFAYVYVLNEPNVECRFIGES